MEDARLRKHDGQEECQRRADPSHPRRRVSQVDAVNGDARLRKHDGQEECSLALIRYTRADPSHPRRRVP